MTEQTGKLAEALAKAQAEMSHAEKDGTNPHFRSKYSTLASIWDACRTPLTKNGLAVVQLPSVAGNLVTIETQLLHLSGEERNSKITMAAKDTSPQAIGSAITYGRRYGLGSMVGVCSDDDDDGNLAQGRPVLPPPAEKEPPAPQLADPLVTKDEVSRVWSFAEAAGWTKADVLTGVKRAFRADALELLTKGQAERLMKGIQERPKKKEGSNGQ